MTCVPNAIKLSPFDNSQTGEEAWQNREEGGVSEGEQIIFRTTYGSEVRTLYLTYPLGVFRFASRILRLCCSALRNRHEKAKFSFSFLLFDLLFFSYFWVLLSLLVSLLVPYLSGFISFELGLFFFLACIIPQAVNTVQCS